VLCFTKDNSVICDYTSKHSRITVKFLYAYLRDPFVACETIP